jgi:hypothetical protein
MRTLIYKRTHSGDPNPQMPVFGRCDCMGRVRGWQFEAVIGIGGIGREPREWGIAGKLTWVGIGALKIFDRRELGEPCRTVLRGPRVTFDDFWCPEDQGPLLEEEYPALARHMRNVPHQCIHSPSPVKEPETDLDGDIEKILELAKTKSRSGQPANRDFQNTPSKCRPNSCRGQ